MMNLKILLPIAAVLGTSSVALARPAVYSGSVQGSVSINYQSPGVRNNPVRVRDHRTQPVRGWDYAPAPAPAQPRMKLLADDLQFGATEYRKDIVPGAAAGKFDMLQLEGVSGRTFIMKVVVEFVGGGVQQFDLNTTLRKDQTLDLDLSGSRRQLNRVLVYRVDSQINEVHRGEFAVLAR